MNEKIQGKSASDDRFYYLRVSTDGELYAIMCGTQADGTVTPLLCDSNGKLIATSS